MRRPVLTVALVAMLMFAGCNAPAQPGADTVQATTEKTTTQAATTSTTTETNATATTTAGAEQGAIEVRDGTLPFNATRVFFRVTALLGTETPPPDTVDIQESEKMTSEARGLPAFAVAMGIGDGSSGSREVATLGSTRGSNYIALNAILTEHPERARGVLVHEYVHIVQFHHGQLDTAHENIQPGSTDSQMAYLGVVEGTPVFIESEYQRAYGGLGGDGMRDMLRGYHRANGVHKYALAPYAFGARYAHNRVGNASQADLMYTDPPTTTETIIHNYTPGEEPVRSLESDISTDSWSWSGRDRLGELFVRQVLVTEVSRERAATAAAGWGVDRHFTFKHGNESAYVWAVRWDSVTDADEFETTTRDYLDARGTKTDDTWHDQGTAFRVQRTSPEVVVLIVGPDPFVDGTNVSSTNSTVTIQTANATAA